MNFIPMNCNAFSLRNITREYFARESKWNNCTRKFKLENTWWDFFAWKIKLWRWNFLLPCDVFFDGMTFLFFETLHGNILQGVME